MNMNNIVMRKSAVKSFFVTSLIDISSQLFDEKPIHDGNDVTVLQVMSLNDKYLLVELIKNEDIGEWKQK